MRRIIADPKGAPDDLTNPLTRPHLAPKAIGLRSTVQESGQLGELLGRELRGRARRGMRPQPFLDAFTASPLQPLAHRPRRDPQGSRDRSLFPAQFFQLPSAPPPSFAPVQPCYCGLHGPTIPYF